MREPRFIQLHVIETERLAAEARNGLGQRPARVSPKFLYDPLGSRLFDAITELDEYYPTRTEAAIFEAHQADIARAVHVLVGPGAGLIDLGAGNCAKAARLFDTLHPARYVAVDISVDFLRQSLWSLQRQHPGLDMAGVGMDFSGRLALPADMSGQRSVVFYPGSSIGNFDPQAALRLLREARELSAGGALLIGVDLLKPTPQLEAAYDDALGVTAAFNLNLLNNLNRLMGSDFDVRDWRHVAFFNDTESRIEMHLAARWELTVRWPGGTRSFDAGERLHTENSYKWRREDFEALLRDAGCTRIRSWRDADEWFGVFLAS